MSRKFSPELLHYANDPTDIHKFLGIRGCNTCELCQLHNGRIKSSWRGNPKSKFMIVGEAPGKEEWEQGKYFVGPAGKLLDKIFQSVGIDTEDWFLDNVVKCRPVAPKWSKKQNKTPLYQYCKACKPYIEKQIEIMQPHIVVLLGRTAASTIIPQLSDQLMKNCVGNTYTRMQWPNTLFYVMYHPAAILHAKDYPERQTGGGGEGWLQRHPTT